MEDNTELINVAMKIIMNAGNARTNANEALDFLSEHDFQSAKDRIDEARVNIIAAHKSQTKIIQDEAAGVKYSNSLLFTHAQDTLMTVMSEVNMSEKMIMIFEKFVNKSIL